MDATAQTFKDESVSINREYKELMGRKDFMKRLEEAIVNDSCLICHGTRVMNDGIDLECGQFLNEKTAKLFAKTYEVIRWVEVKKR